MAYGQNSYKGRFQPSQPKKYRGDIHNIIYRSAWELKFMAWADRTDSVIEWSSEETVVHYRSPVDNKMHRYFLDFKIKVSDKNGNLQTYLIEVKPKSMCYPPKVPQRKTKSYTEAVYRWGVNKAKWDSAANYANDRGWKFQILTEDHLGIK